MTRVDLGRPLVAEGRCLACSLDARPLWTCEGRAICAGCCTRALPGIPVTFHDGPALTATQEGLPGLAA